MRWRQRASPQCQVLESFTEFARTVRVMRPISFESQIQALQSRLSLELPGTPAHLTMAPGYRHNPEHLSIDGKSCRKAGVLAILYPHLPSSPGILLTKRREDLPVHAGQISFPGGRQEGEETLVETALRETEEEIGLRPSRVQVVGQLSPIYISVSNYCVHPFVGILSQAPTTFNIQEDEVQNVLTLPLQELAAPETRREEIKEIDGYPARIPAFHIEREIIWGATAMILAELLILMDMYPTPVP